jgi:hypothetical protein
MVMYSAEKRGIILFTWYILLKKGEEVGVNGDA